MKKRFCMLFALLALLACGAKAQGSFINIEDMPSKTQADATLSGSQAAAILLANSNNLVVRTNNPNDVIQQPTQTSDGLWAYRVVADVSEADDRKFTVTRKGTAISAEKKKVLRVKQCIYLRVQDVEHPIIVQRKVSRNSLYAHSGKTCIVFDTPLDGMTIQHNPVLGGKVTNERSSSGTNLIYLELDVAKLDAVRQQRDTDPQAYEEAVRIAISSPKTNVEYVDTTIINELSNKKRIDLAIIDLAPEKEGTTAFAEMMRTANNAFDARRYSQAKGFFEQAAQQPDVTEAQRVLCMDRAETCDTCIQLRDEANKALALIKKYKDEGREVSISTVEQLYNVAISNYRTLYTFTTDEFYQKRAQKLTESLGKIGIVYQGTVEITDFKQGVLQKYAGSGFDIYGVGVPYSKDLAKGAHGTHLGKTDGQGGFKLEVPRDANYRCLLFVPNGNSHTKKNGYQNVDGTKAHQQLAVTISND